MCTKLTLRFPQCWAGGNKICQAFSLFIQLFCTKPILFAIIVSKYKHVMFRRSQKQRWSRGYKARGQGQGHKKIQGQGQGQPFRGQTLSRPRTGMLEAKAKDQGHKRKCSPKKKGLHKNFSGDLQKKKGLHKNFSSDLHKKTFSKKFFKPFTKF